MPARCRPKTAPQIPRSQTQGVTRIWRGRTLLSEWTQAAKRVRALWGGMFHTHAGSHGPWAVLHMEAFPLFARIRFSPHCDHTPGSTVICSLSPSAMWRMQPRKRFRGQLQKSAFQSGRPLCAGLTERLHVGLSFRCVSAAGSPSGKAELCKSSIAGSIPAPASKPKLSGAPVRQVFLCFSEGRSRLHPPTLFVVCRRLTLFQRAAGGIHEGQKR